MVKVIKEINFIDHIVNKYTYNSIVSDIYYLLFKKCSLKKMTSYTSVRKKNLVGKPYCFYAEKLTQNHVEHEI